MSLLTQASLILTPTAYKASRLYSIVPSSGNGDMTVVRATAATATRVNSSGVVELVGVNVPRLNYDSLGSASILLEPQRTNVLLNSATLSTQAVTTTAVSYSLSFYGTGTIVLSGAFVGTLVGTGVSNRVSLTFTSTAAPLTLTVTGSVTNAQLEVGAYPTSYIPTTTTALTRNQDTVVSSSITDLIGQTEGVLFVESAAFVSLDNVNTRAISITDGTATNRIQIQYNTFNTNGILYLIQSNGGTSQFDITTNYVTTNFNKIAIRYKVNDFTLWINGVKVFTIPLVQAMPINLSKLSFDNGVGANVFLSKVKQLQLYKTFLTDAEMTSLTTL